MQPSTTYHMRAHVDWSPGLSWVDQDQTFTTGALPNQASATEGGPLVLPTLTVTRPSPKLEPSPGVELINVLPPGNSNFLGTLVTDLAGNIIWYYDVIAM